MPKILLDHCLEVLVFLLTVAVDVFINPRKKTELGKLLLILPHLPFVDDFRVDLLLLDESSEHFNRPRIAEGILHIFHIHAKIIAKALLSFEWNLTYCAMHT